MGGILAVVASFVVLGLLGMLIGRNKDIHLAGAFLAGCFGIFGWIFLLAIPKRESEAPRPPSGDPIKGALVKPFEWLLGLLLFVYIHLRIAFVAMSFLLILGPLAIVAALTVEDDSDQLTWAVLMTVAGVVGLTVTWAGNKYHGV